MKMADWKEFEAATPDLAAAGKKLLYQFGVGLAFLATLRKDGAPRLHPVCLTIVDGMLSALIGPTHKGVDLKRDGRYALHSFPGPNKDDEFLVMGRARFVDDPKRTERVREDLKARGVTSTEDDDLFEFGIDRAMHADYPGGHGTWPPKYSTWKLR
jgi:hypothetical protein